MAQKIIFKPSPEHKRAGHDENAIVPSSLMVPDFYKNIPPNVAGDITRHGSTVKKCVPYLDALMMGYTIKLPYDILVQDDEENNKVIRLIADVDNIEVEHLYRVNGLAVPQDYYPVPWRFVRLPHIDTPKGYSVLITHPLNRWDLPFLTLSGVIDTDSYSVGAGVTFYIRNDFVGIIAKGTPLAQAIPFKRENWEHEYGDALTLEEEKKWQFKLLSIIERSYQKQFWKRKSYK